MPTNAVALGHNHPYSRPDFKEKEIDFKEKEYSFTRYIKTIEMSSNKKKKACI